MRVLYLNNAELEKHLKLQGVSVIFSEPWRADLAAIIEFKSPEGTLDDSDVYKVLGKLKDKGNDIPVCVLDSTFRPGQADRLWRYSNVARYLPLDQGPRAWQEIHSVIHRRMEARASIVNLKDEDCYPVGWSVAIEAEDYDRFNFVSLFIGHMADFIVFLNRILERLKPNKLEFNPVKDGREEDLPLLMEMEQARRLGRTEYECPIDGKKYTRQGILKRLKASNAEQIFREGNRALSQSHFLIQGETGSGKTIIAQHIHNYLYEDVRDHEDLGKLRKVTCTNLGEKIFDNELFGSVEGFFTDGITQPGAIFTAYNGTVFLDEIGDLPLAAQAKLLQYLDDRTIRPTGWLRHPIFVPAIVVAATNKDLSDEVQKGSFRLDLFHRFRFKIEIPPLRKRTEDMERLVDFVLQNPRINPLIKKGTKKRHIVQRIEKAAITPLRDYEFPGNFRELEQILKEAVIMADCKGLDIITAAGISGVIRKAKAQAKSGCEVAE